MRNIQHLKLYGTGVMLEQCGVWIGGELKSKYGQHGQYGINNEASMESVKH